MEIDMELKVQLIIEILNLQQRIDLTEMDFMKDIYLQLISQRQDELKLLAEVEGLRELLNSLKQCFSINKRAIAFK